MRSFHETSISGSFDVRFFRLSARFPDSKEELEFFGKSRAFGITGCEPKVGTNAKELRRKPQKKTLAMNKLLLICGYVSAMPEMKGLKSTVNIRVNANSMVKLKLPRTRLK